MRCEHGSTCSTECCVPAPRASGDTVRAPFALAVLSCAADHGAVVAMSPAAVDAWLLAATACLRRPTPPAAPAPTQAPTALIAAAIRWACIVQGDSSAARTAARASAANLVADVAAFATGVATRDGARRGDMTRALTSGLLALDAAAGTTTASVLAAVWKLLVGLATDAMDGVVQLDC